MKTKYSIYEARPNKSHRFFIKAGLVLLVHVLSQYPDLCFGAVSFGDIGNNITENTKGIAEAVKFVGFTGGIGSAVWGGFEMFKAGKGHSDVTTTGGFRKVIVGGLLLAITAFIGAGSTTIFGTDETTGLDELGI